MAPSLLFSGSPVTMLSVRVYKRENEYRKLFKKEEDEDVEY